MHIEDNTSAPNDSALRTNVTDLGSPAATPSYDIAPEDQHHADAILAIDPINGVPGPYEIPTGKRFPALKLTALPKEQQREVLEKLSGVPAHLRDAKEAEFTADAIREMRPYLRMMSGVGKGATLYHREMASVARDAYDLDREFELIQERLDEIVGHDTVTDPGTGEAKPVPIHRIQGARRTAVMNEQRLIFNRRSALMLADGSYGHEGAKRMRVALYESVMARKALQEQFADEAEVKAQTAAEIRAERIRKRVEAGVARARVSA